MNKSFITTVSWSSLRACRRPVNCRDLVYPSHRTPTRPYVSIGKPQGRLVVVGSGWAGLKLLGGINTAGYDVVMVSPRNHFVFTPLLASTSVGTLEFRAITEPVRHHNRKAKYFQAKCDSVDLAKKEIHCASALPGMGPFTLKYDKLVIAVGAYSNTFGIPGVEKYGFFLKEISHAQRLRARIIECFEMASEPNCTEEQQWRLLNFAVVGGGPTGVEFSAELHDFVKDDLRKLYPQLIDKVQITVYDVAEKILGSFDDALSDYAAKKFRREGIKIRTRTFIKEVQENKLILQDGSELPFGCLVWATGITATPLVRAMDVTKTKNERLLTDEYLRVLDKDGNPVPGVYAMGDCATVGDLDLPATAQVATQQGVWLRKHLNSAKTEESGKPFKYSHMGSMVYVGDWKAIFEASTNNVRRGLRGRLAWFIWRSAYMVKSVSARNMVLIPVTW
ncbi:hypothetical protein HDU85_005049 [Gaertneriomyces sp. JEL0708]|nr:hypothetical protein HDU85_005049 [Gaertneriomyces sp. JEL0708]